MTQVYPRWFISTQAEEAAGPVHSKWFELEQSLQSLSHPTEIIMFLTCANLTNVHDDIDHAKDVWASKYQGLIKLNKRPMNID